MEPIPPSLLGPDFAINPLTFQLTNVPHLLVPANPDRFALWWECDNTGSFFVSTRPAMNHNNGYLVGNSQINPPFLFYQIGPMVAMAWYGVSVNVGPTTGFAQEIVYSPRRR